MLKGEISLRFKSHVPQGFVPKTGAIHYSFHTARTAALKHFTILFDRHCRLVLNSSLKKKMDWF